MTDFTPKPGAYTGDHVTVSIADIGQQYSISDLEEALANQGLPREWAPSRQTQRSAFGRAFLERQHSPEVERRLSRLSGVETDDRILTWERAGHRSAAILLRLHKGQGKRRVTVTLAKIQLLSTKSIALDVEWGGHFYSSDGDTCDAANEEVERFKRAQELHLNYVSHNDVRRMVRDILEHRYSGAPLTASCFFTPPSSAAHVRALSKAVETLGNCKLGIAEQFAVDGSRSIFAEQITSWFESEFVGLIEDLKSFDEKTRASTIETREERVVELRDRAIAMRMVLGDYADKIEQMYTKTMNAYVEHATAMDSPEMMGCATGQLERAAS